MARRHPRARSRPPHSSECSERTTQLRMRAMAHLSLVDECHTCVAGAIVALVRHYPHRYTKQPSNRPRMRWLLIDMTVATTHLNTGLATTVNNSRRRSIAHPPYPNIWGESSGQFGERVNYSTGFPRDQYLVEGKIWAKSGALCTVVGRDRAVHSAVRMNGALSQESGPALRYYLKKRRSCRDQSTGE